MSRIILSAASRVGNVRSNNEDMVLAFDRFVRSDVYATEFMTGNSDRFVIALADGMGGHNAGEVASSDVLTNLRFFLGDLPPRLSTGDFYEMMEEWLQSVNHMISSKGHVNPEMAEMGTTLVGVIFYNDKYYWMNCGDSRLYRYRDNKLAQLTTDHSLINKNGVKKHSNIITNCIGGGCSSSFMDIVMITQDVKEGDVYLLCTDGLTDMLPDHAISTLLEKGSDANALCDAAVAAGGLDNVSCCVMKF